MTAQALRQRDLEDIKSVMSTEAGRRFIWRLLEQAGLFRTSFTGEINSTLFREGNRNAGLALFNTVFASCPELYLTMAQEATATPPTPPENHEEQDEQ